jgi:hypothetical protein
MPDAVDKSQHYITDQDSNSHPQNHNRLPEAKLDISLRLGPLPSRPRTRDQCTLFGISTCSVEKAADLLTVTSKDAQCHRKEDQSMTGSKDDER